MISKKDSTLKKYINNHFHGSLSHVDGIYVSNKSEQLLNKLKTLKSLDDIIKTIDKNKLSNVALSTEFMELNSDGDYEFNAEKLLNNYGNYEIIYILKYLDNSVIEQNKDNENYEPSENDYRYKLIISKEFKTSGNSQVAETISEDGVVNIDKSINGYLVYIVAKFGRETYLVSDEDKSAISYALFPIAVVKTRKDALATCSVRKDQKTAFAPIKKGKVIIDKTEIYYSSGWNNSIEGIDFMSCTI